MAVSNTSTPPGRTTAQWRWAGALVVAGAVLPVVASAVLGSITTDYGDGTWAGTVQPTAFLLLSVGLAVGHLLVVVGYREVARLTTGAGSRLAALGGLGTAAVAAVEIWSGLEAETDLGAPVIDVLNGSYFVCSLLILVGTLGAGIVLTRAKSKFGMPLLVNGGFFLLVIPVRFLASDALAIAALVMWSLLYVWLGIVLGIRRERVRS